MRHLAFGFITQSLGARHCICRLIKPTTMEEIDVTCGQNRNSDAINVIKVLVPDHKELGVLEFVDSKNTSTCSSASKNILTQTILDCQ